MDAPDHKPSFPEQGAKDYAPTRHIPRRAAPIKRRRRGLLLLGAAALLLGLLATLWLVEFPPAPGPPRGALESAPPRPETSLVTIPVSLPLSELARFFEEEIPEVLIHDQGKDIGDGNLLDTRVRRTGKIRVRSEDGRLIASMPLSFTARSYSAKRAKKRAERDRKPPAGKLVSAKMVLTLSLGITLSDDWRLETATSLSHRWLSKPTLKLGIFKFGVQRFVDDILEVQYARISRKMDKKMREDDLLRAAVEKVWAELGAQRRLIEDPATWWVGELDALYATSPTVDEEALRITLGLAGRFRVLLGEPGPKAPLPPLPPRADPPGEGGFRLAVSTALRWEELSRVARLNLGGQTWPLSADARITAKDIELYPSGEKIVVALTYQATLPGHSTDGTLYFLGRPVLDAKAQVLTIEGFDYVLSTWDEAVASVNALAESGIKDKFREKLAFPFGEQLDEARRRIDEGLQKPSQEGAILEGELDTLSLSGVRLTDEAVVIDAVASGELSLTMSMPKERGVRGERRGVRGEE